MNIKPIKYPLLLELWNRTYSWLIDFQIYCREVDSGITNDSHSVLSSETKVKTLAESKDVILETLTLLKVEDRPTRKYIDSLTNLLESTTLFHNALYISPPQKLNLLDFEELKNRSPNEIVESANLAQPELQRRWVSFNQIYALLLIKSPIDGFNLILERGDSIDS